jgi:hypothetical protein
MRVLCRPRIVACRGGFDGKRQRVMRERTVRAALEICVQQLLRARRVTLLSECSQGIADEGRIFTSAWRR